MSSPTPPVSPASATGHWNRTPERSNVVALKVMRWIALTCGRRVARGVLHAVTGYFLLFSPGPRRHSRRYLDRALGRPARWADLYRHFFTFTATVLDRVYLLRGRFDLFDVRVSGQALIDDVIGEGRGAVLIGAHAGSFEVLRAVGHARTGLRIAMVMYPDNARMINAALQAIAPDYRAQIIALGQRDSMLEVRDWLDGGGLAGLLGDRALAGGSKRPPTVPIPFLGHPALFGDGPFRLAAILRRKVCFMVGIYAGGDRYDLHFEALADFTERLDDPAARERQIRSALLAYAARLETLCREHPYNWFNFHDFWQEDRP